MNDEKLTGQSSLQIIEQMLNATKREDVKGLSTHFAIWGIACFVVGLVTYLVTSMLDQPLWNLLWFLLFLVPQIQRLITPIEEGHAITFLEEGVRHVFSSLGALFVALTLGIIAASVFTQVIDFSVMLPLAVLFTSFTSMQVWGMVRRKGYAAWALLLLFLGVVLFCHISQVGFQPIHDLLGGILFGLNFLIPALFYRHKGSAK